MSKSIPTLTGIGSRAEVVAVHVGAGGPVLVLGASPIPEQPTPCVLRNFARRGTISWVTSPGEAQHVHDLARLRRVRNRSDERR